MLEQRYFSSFINDMSAGFITEDQCHLWNTSKLKIIYKKIVRKKVYTSSLKKIHAPAQSRLDIAVQYSLNQCPYFCRDVDYRDSYV